MKNRKICSAMAVLVLGAACFASQAMAQASQLPLPPPVEKELAARASNVTEVTLGKNMLSFASKFMNGKDKDEAATRRLIEGLEGIYVREYEFDKEGQYSPEDIDKLRFNRCVAHIYEFANALSAEIGDVGASGVTPDFAWAMREAADILVQLFHPMMPHLAEECWAALGHDTLVSAQSWPKVEADLLVEEKITLPVQVNGKKRADVTVKRDAGNADIEAAVLTLDAVKKALEGRPPKKVIIVPRRIVNVVA